MNILKNADVYGGGVLVIPLSAGILLHEGTKSEPIKFALRFDPPIDGISFERPSLIAGESGIWFPEWSAHVFSGDVELMSKSEGSDFHEGIRYFDLDKMEHALEEAIRKAKELEGDDNKKQQAFEEVQRQRAFLRAVQLNCDKRFPCGRSRPYPAFRFEYEHPGITRVEFRADGHGGAALNSVSLYNIRLLRRPK